MDMIIFTGRVGNDPQIKTTTTGSKYAFFSVAVNHVVKGEKKTEWRSCTAWEKKAEFVQQYLKKGQLVTICGQPSPHLYQNKMDETVPQINVTVNTIDFGSPKNDSEAAPSENTDAATATPVTPPEDLPF